MVVTFEVEEELKKNLILDALTCISTDGTPISDGKKSENWEKIIPPPVGSSLEPVYSKLSVDMSHAFRISPPHKERNHFVERKPVTKVPPKNPTFL